MDKIKAFFTYGSEFGLRLPAAYNSDTGKPSITLLAVHVAIWLVVAISLLGLKFDLSNQVWQALAFYAIANTFYLIKKITKVKLDADDKSLELEGGSDEIHSG